jgi:parallel beta-helix repeat protein
MQGSLYFSISGGIGMMKQWVAVVLVLLFLGTSIISTTAQKDMKASQSPTKGMWLYVGGSGPGNYTRIQDAVDNATDGDTVFVYDDSSPYRENIVINTSLSLIGEDKATTIINGSINGSGGYANQTFGVVITAGNVTVRGFTIQSCNFSGIIIESKNNKITDTILLDNFYGVTTNSENTITDNLLVRDQIGICVSSGGNNSVRGNVVSQARIGILVMLSMNDNVSNNVISQNYDSVLIIGSYNTLLYRNNISFNSDIGVYTVMTSADKILQNNFIGNNISAKSTQNLMLKIQLFQQNLHRPILRNVWNNNYWDRPRLLPYIIPGKLRFWVDWHPALKPFDIPSMN